jgi:hypothetical protein
MNTKQTAFRLDPEVLEVLEKIAKAEHRTKTEEVEWLILQEEKRQKGEDK